MADDFDPCECVFSYDGTMQRLLTLLRNSQAYCTNEECFPNASGPLAPPSSDTDGTVMMFAVGWAVLALVLFFMRPSLSLGGNKKPSSGNGPRQPPPDNSVQ